MGATFYFLKMQIILVEESPRFINGLRFLLQGLVEYVSYSDPNTFFAKNFFTKKNTIEIGLLQGTKILAKEQDCILITNGNMLSVIDHEMVNIDQFVKHYESLEKILEKAKL